MKEFFWGFAFVMALPTFTEVYYGFTIDPFLYMAVFVVFGIFSRDFYFLHLLRITDKLERTHNPEKKRKIMDKYSGVNADNAYKALPLLFLIIFASAVIASVLSGNNFLEGYDFDLLEDQGKSLGTKA